MQQDEKGILGFADSFGYYSESWFNPVVKSPAESFMPASKYYELTQNQKTAIKDSKKRFAKDPDKTLKEDIEIEPEIVPIEISVDQDDFLGKNLRDPDKISFRRNKLNANSNNSLVDLENSLSLNESCQSKGNESLVVDTTKDLHSLANWNLPSSIVNEYRKKGIEVMFEWQVECLKNPNVLFKSSNLVYCAPTSAGKTLVSEVLMIKSILERKKKAIFIHPFVSVVREKTYYMQNLLQNSGLRVEGFYGGYNPAGTFDSIDLSICTIEKANSIVNRLMEQNKLEDIGTIVIDEVHLISDASRGYILELLLTKILYMCRVKDMKIQIITMSATVPNLSLLKDWLQAEFYLTDFRPIDLNEMIKVGKDIFNNRMERLRSVKNEYAEFFPNDSDDISQLCMETLAEKFQLIM